MKLNFYALWRAATAACLIFLYAINSGLAQGIIYHPPIQNVGPILPAGAEADTAFSHRMNYIFGSLE
jgi:hypothetical protein